MGEKAIQVKFSKPGVGVRVAYRRRTRGTERRRRRAMSDTACHVGTLAEDDMIPEEAYHELANVLILGIILN